MGKQLHATIGIDATPQRVWQILTDFAAYPDWNPFITRASGTASPSERLRLRMQPPGGRPAAAAPPYGPRCWRPTPAGGCAGSATCCFPACSTATTASSSNPLSTVASASPSRSSSAASCCPLPPGRLTATLSPDSNK